MFLKINKKGIFLDEVKWGLGILLFLVIMGIVIYLITTAFGISIFDWFRYGFDAITGNVNSTYIGGLA